MAAPFLKVKVEGGPEVVVRKPTEDEVVRYRQHRIDAEDPERAASQSDAQDADDVLASCVTSPSAEEWARLVEDWPHLPRQISDQFEALASPRAVRDAPQNLLTEDHAKKAQQRRERLVGFVVDEDPARALPAAATPPAPSPDAAPTDAASQAAPARTGKLVVAKRLSRSVVQFMEAEYVAEKRRSPTVQQFARVGRSHVVESPDGCLQEYPLLCAWIGARLWKAAAAKIGVEQGK